MKIVRYSEMRKMETDSAAVKCHHVIYLSSFYKPEVLTAKIERHKAMEKTIKLQIQLGRLDLMIQSRYDIWSNLGASDELIEIRKELIEESFLEEYRMSQEEIKKKYENKDTYTFENNLAAETIEKSGIDPEYEKAKRIKTIMTETDPEAAERYQLPEEMRNPDPELKTKVDIMSFIKGRIYNFFNGIDDYAVTDTLDEDVSETETLEEPVETLGV